MRKTRNVAELQKQKQFTDEAKQYYEETIVKKIATNPTFDQEFYAQLAHIKEFNTGNRLALRRIYLIDSMAATRQLLGKARSNLVNQLSSRERSREEGRMNRSELAEHMQVDMTLLSRLLNLNKNTNDEDADWTGWTFRAVSHAILAEYCEMSFEEFVLGRDVPVILPSGLGFVAKRLSSKTSATFNKINELQQRMQEIHSKHRYKGIYNFDEVNRLALKRLEELLVDYGIALAPAASPEHNVVEYGVDNPKAKMLVDTLLLSKSMNVAVSRVLSIAADLNGTALDYFFSRVYTARNNVAYVENVVDEETGRVTQNTVHVSNPAILKILSYYLDLEEEVQEETLRMLMMEAAAI